MRKASELQHILIKVIFALGVGYEARKSASTEDYLLLSLSLHPSVSFSLSLTLLCVCFFLF